MPPKLITLGEISTVIFPETAILLILYDPASEPPKASVPKLAWVIVTPFDAFADEAVPEPDTVTLADRLFGSTKLNKAPETVNEPS